MMVASSQGGLLTRDHVPDSSIESLKDFVPASTLWTDKENKWQNKIWKYGQKEQKLQNKYKQGKLSKNKFEDKVCTLAEKCETQLEKAYDRHNSQWFQNLDLASKLDVTKSKTICDHLKDLGECRTPAPTSAPTTVAPTTFIPTSFIPTTVPPTTFIPTTVAPTTVAPTTVAPTTVAPTTVAPTTVAPTTVAPTTVAPTTVAPTTFLPTTFLPTTFAPTTVAPP